MSELYHHGIKGMKWGIRRTRKQLDRAAGRIKKSSDDTAENKQNIKKVSSAKSSVKSLSDDELKKRIRRLQDEKTYRDLLKSEEQPKIFDGKKFVISVLEQSGKNIATQATTYAMGTAVNKMVRKDIVNPKKGQKDK